uniref:Uncharacterized protein n=1 Tax=Klebsiella pneumoniae TaxID=573 RepID=A0A8B0STE1_KLEPN|nr:hypothetical protein [Klebsiella pneumoniae]
MVDKLWELANSASVFDNSLFAKRPELYSLLQKLLSKKLKRFPLATLLLQRCNTYSCYAVMASSLTLKKA